MINDLNRILYYLKFVKASCDLGNQVTLPPYKKALYNTCRLLMKIMFTSYRVVTIRIFILHIFFWFKIGIASIFPDLKGEPIFSCHQSIFYHEAVMLLNGAFR